MFLLVRENNDGTMTFLSTHGVDQSMICGCTNQENLSVHTLGTTKCYCNNETCKGVSYDAWVNHFMKEENVKEDEIEDAVLKLRKVDATLDFYIDYSLSNWNNKVSLRLRGVNSAIKKSKRNCRKPNLKVM